MQIKETEKVTAPWRRFFARSFDLSVYSVIWNTFLTLAVNLHLESRTRSFMDSGGTDCVCVSDVSYRTCPSCSDRNDSGEISVWNTCHRDGRRPASLRAGS